MLDEIPLTHKTINALLTVLPHALNVLIIVLVLLTIFSVIGVELFCFLKHGNEIDAFNQNYESFYSAFFSLIKFSTMESPIEQIKDASRTFQPNFICF